MSDLMFVVPTFSGGGAERVIRLIAAEAVKLGRRCCIVGLYETAHSASMNSKSGVGYIGLNAPNFLCAVFLLTALVRKEKPKALLSTLKNACLATEIARRIAAPRSVHVIRVANSYVQELERMKFLRRAVWRTAIRFMHFSADRTILVSHGLREEVIGLLPTLQSRAVVIHNPVEVTHASMAPTNVRQGAQDSRRVLMVGRLAPQKDHLTALAAFALVRVKAELLIVGEGELRQEISTRASSLGISDRVHLLGWRSDVPALLADSDLFLLTSRYEGFPNVLIEAMLAGIPIVATDCPHGPLEIVNDTRIGQLVRVGDTIGLAAAINDWLTRPICLSDREYRKLTATKRYSLAHTAVRYLEALAK